MKKTNYLQLKTIYRLSGRLSLLMIFSIFSNTCIATEGWTISSDSHSENLKLGSIIYRGNAAFKSESLTLKGDQIQLKESTLQVEVSGNPASMVSHSEESTLRLNSQNLEYQVESQTLNAMGNVELLIDDSKSRQIIFNGDSVQSSKINSGKLILIGRPASISISQPNQETITASANRISYDQSLSIFDLMEQVTLETKSKRIKAGSISYNIDSGTMETKKSKDQQVEMTQLKEPTQ